MKIGLLSDTHLTKSIDVFLDNIKRFFHDVDIIIHAGDYISPQLIHGLSKFKKFIGVWGNVDSQEIRSELKEREVFHIEGYTLGIYHGHGEGKTTIDRAYNQFKDEDVDIIIYGHSHQPLIKTYKNVLMINPGSPTSKRKEQWFSYGVLNFNEGNIEVSLKFFTQSVNSKY